MTSRSWCSSASANNVGSLVKPILDGMSGESHAHSRLECGKMGPPDVSIVCITYNHETYIGDALRSFLEQRQDGFRFEIIVADDASTDGTPEIVAQFCEPYPELMFPILRQHNVGIQRNLLDAMTKARGRYIALCEGDDYWIDSSKVVKQVRLLDADPSASLCFHPTRVTFAGNSESDSVWPKLDNAANFSVERLIMANYIPTNSVMYRNLGDYRSLVVGDVLPLDRLLHLMHAMSGRILFVDEVMSVYRRHPGGVWWDGDGRTAFWSRNAHRYMAMYENMARIVGEDTELEKLVLVSMERTFSDIVRDLDDEQPEALFDLVANYPAYASRALNAMHMRESELRTQLEGTVDRRLAGLARRLVGQLGHLTRGIVALLPDKQRKFSDGGSCSRGESHPRPPQNRT